MRLKKYVFSMKRAILLTIVVGVAAGCATGPGERITTNDRKSVRNLVDAMASPAHRFPANIPR